MVRIMKDEDATEALNTVLTLRDVHDDVQFSYRIVDGVDVLEMKFSFDGDDYGRSTEASNPNAKAILTTAAKVMHARLLIEKHHPGDWAKWIETLGTRT